MTPERAESAEKVGFLSLKCKPVKIKFSNSARLKDQFHASVYVNMEAIKLPIRVNNVFKVVKFSAH